MSGSQNAVELLKQAQNLGFVDFTKSLVAGVFDVVVQSQIDQLKAFAELVSQVAKTLAEYQTEVTGIDFSSGNPEDAAVAPKLNAYIKDVLSFDTTTATNNKFPLDETEYKLLQNHFGSEVDTATAQEVVVPTATAEGNVDLVYLRGLVFDKLDEESAKQYNMLVEVLRVGFARIDVTEGYVQTGMRLSVTGLDEEVATSYSTDTRANNWHAGGSVSGIFKKIGFGVSGAYTSSRLRVNVSSERSTSRTTVDAFMTGEVRINFATTSFDPRVAPVQPA